MKYPPLTLCTLAAVVLILRIGEQRLVLGVVPPDDDGRVPPPIVARHVLVQLQSDVLRPDDELREGGATRSLTHCHFISQLH